GKLRIPHIVGMVLAGVAVGPHGLNILAKDSSFDLFGHVGLYYIMFLAGLEMNMSNFRKNRVRTFTHGIMAFVIPMAMGFVINRSILHYSVMTSILLASMYASHTIITYPIVMRYGLTRQRSVTIAVGATAITDTLTLLVLAIVGGMFKGEITGGFWLMLFLKIAAVFLIIMYVFPRIAKHFFHRHEDNVAQFIFMLAMTFLGAWLMELIGMEGLLGAFLTGLALNRYVPNVSPLMLHLEFVGNAIFIPYFLIGVGMLVNVKLLFGGLAAFHVAGVMILVALTSKWIASLLTQKLFGMRGVERELIYGLSNAQAGATLAAVMVGYNLITPDGQRLLNDDVLNGTVILILVTCIFSSFMTERASKRIALESQAAVPEEDTGDDEKIMVSMKHKETADTLISLATMMRNRVLNRGIVALNVVYDDTNRLKYQERGRSLLEHVVKTANSTGVMVQTQVRIATNIINGIKHAFKEYNASEIIMGMHSGDEEDGKFWGEFIPGLFSGLNRQITIVRCLRPLNTIRRIQVAVPSRAEFEPGFYRWLERLARVAENLECRIQFHAKRETLSLINQYVQNRHPNVRAEYTYMAHWIDMPKLSEGVEDDHLFVVITARKGTISYKSALERLPEELTRHFSGKSLMIIFPDQYGEPVGAMTFAEPQHHEQRSAYEVLTTWIRQKFK
ncbi:MAG TPA: cation:proton antiporter, partial [Candidatus Prevotella stercoripullorum]|nr:cation:proton antiporter [Candidatus Prevotella stercoripullorum]